MGSKYTEAQKRASQKYIGEFDDIKIRVPKGMRDVYKAFAKERGTSLNQLVIDLLEESMKNG